MKTNKMLRISAILLVLTLLSTCVISGTFAKYTTTGQATDSARVAKWGVEVKAETPDDNEYEDEVKSVDGQVIVTIDEKVLAPGTSVYFASLDITGTPEVEVLVTYTADLALTNWKVDVTDDNTVNPVDYMPLVFVINGVHYSIDGLGLASISEFETKIEEIIAAYSKQYDEGTKLEDRAAEELTVSCYWAFEKGAGGQNDSADTYLGNQATIDGNAPTVSLTITCTVTQID